MSNPTVVTNWDLMLDSAASASRNMAKDALLLERAARTGRTVLRLYQWRGFALSLGQSQKPARELNLESCLEAGIPLVRRITGGRAVLHGEDLTYSLCAPVNQPPFQGGILHIYRQISEALLGFLTQLGQQPKAQDYSGRQRAALISPICFATPSAYEILIDGKKLIGSAQRLMAKAFLQHGSLPLRPQGPMLARLFRGARAEEVAAMMTDLETLGVMARVSLDELREAFVAAFAESFGVRFLPAPWSDADEALLAQKEKAFQPLDIAMLREELSPR